MKKAEEEAIDVFARNLTALLMAAPAGAKSTMGLDPGLRTGVKVAVVDNTGKLLDTTTIYPHTGREAEAQVAIFSLIRKHNVELIAIGNGTASRETERFAKDVIKEIKENKPQTVVVSEAGASVYSASEFAANEFPNLDVFFTWCGINCASFTRSIGRISENRTESHWCRAIST